MKTFRVCYLLLIAACIATGMFQFVHSQLARFRFTHNADVKLDTAEPNAPRRHYKVSAVELSTGRGSPASQRAGDLSYCPSTLSRYVVAHNRLGQQVGWALRPGSRGFHSFLWEGTQEHDLGTLGGKLSYAVGINDSGQVIGNSETGLAVRHAFLWSAGKMVDLGTLGGEGSYAFAINNRGQIVGNADTPDHVTHAFLYQHGKMTDLGTLGGRQSAAHSINDRGQIVGYSDTRLDAFLHAFLWENGAMIDLNRALPDRSGWELKEAEHISEDGRIVGLGEKKHEPSHNFLLTPY